MYKIVIDHEDSDALHFRVLTVSGDEVFAGGVDRVEYDDLRRTHGYSKEATLWEFAKKRGGLDGEVIAQPPLPFDGELPVAAHDHPGFSTPHDIDALRDELLNHINSLDDGSLRKLREDFGTHTHSQYLTGVPAHGHAAMDTRLGAVEVTLEAQSTHTHTLPKHEHQHDHAEFYKLNDANVVLAQEVRAARQLVTEHHHPHGHDDLLAYIEAVEAEVANFEPTVVTPEFALPDHKHKHEHQSDSRVEDLLARVEELETKLSKLANRKTKTPDLRVLSREERGGKHIIIAEEL